METLPHTISKKCSKCDTPLVLGDNWSEGIARGKTYLCRACNAAKGRAFYAANPKRVIEVAKQRRHANPEKVREYWRQYRKDNPDAAKGWSERYNALNRSSLKRGARRMFTACRSKARYSNVAFDLTPEWIEERLASGVCEATSLPFDFGLPPRADRGSRTPAFAPSLDRIERGGGYTKDNVRVTVFIYNVARSDFNDNELLTLAKALAA